VIKRHGLAAVSSLLVVVAIVLLAADQAHPAVFLVLGALAIALLSPVIHSLTGWGKDA
jgi:multisubunit Na+/H+ antiporter MnhG subunit